MKKESKSCVICGSPIYRNLDHSDHTWLVKMYCKYDCSTAGVYIRYLEKRGYKVVKI